MTYDRTKTVNRPVTKDVLKACLRKLGVRTGQVIEVHASLSSFDYVIGGARTIVDALMESVGPEGTILMPTQSADNSEPSEWKSPAVEPEMYRQVRMAIPPYDADKSDIPGIGAVAENFRHREGVVRTDHPVVSFAAWGKYAKLLCNRQSFHYPLADESPSARLYELKGFVLLLGCGFDTVTSMHLAEYKTDARPIKIEGCCINTANGTEWRSYLDLDTDSSVFERIRSEMHKKNVIHEITLAGSHIQFFPVQYAVDEATEYIEKKSVFELYR